MYAGRVAVARPHILLSKILSFYEIFIYILLVVEPPSADYRISGEEMRVLGKVQDISHDGKLIIRGTTTPATGSLIFDNKRRCIGKIRRIFGPVNAPYIIVEPADDTILLRAIGKQVYIKGVDNNGKGKRRHRRN